MKIIIEIKESGTVPGKVVLDCRSEGMPEATRLEAAHADFIRRLMPQALAQFNAARGGQGTIHTEIQ